MKSKTENAKKALRQIIDGAILGVANSNYKPDAAIKDVNAAVDRLLETFNGDTERKLYLVSTVGLGDYYVIASSFDEAKNELKKQLDIADYGFYATREVTGIKIITDEVNIGFNGKLNFANNRRLIIKKQVYEKTNK